MSNYRRYFINKNPVFLTVVTYNRKNILTYNIELLRKAFEITKKYYDFDIVVVGCV